MKDPKDPGTQDWVDRITLKNEDGTLNMTRDPHEMLTALGNHIADGLLDPTTDLINLMDEVHAVTCYWLMDREAAEFPEHIEKDIKRHLN